MTPEHFVAITTPLPEAMFLVSGNGQFITANPAACRLAEISSLEIKGKFLAEMVAEPTEQVDKFLRTCSRNSSLIPGSLTWFISNGQTIACRCHGAMIRPQTKKVPFLVMLRCKAKSQNNEFMILNQQLADLQKAHHELQKHRNKLELEVKTRTQELESSHQELTEAYRILEDTQSQILQREKMASIGQLAAGVAHEINNPMGFITSNLGTLRKYAVKLLEFITKQAEMLKYLTSEEESKKMQKNRKILKIDYITKDVDELIEESMEGANRVKKIVQGLKNFSRDD